MLTFISIIISLFAATVIGLVVCVIMLFRKVTAVRDHARWENKRVQYMISDRSEDLEKRLYLLAEECGFTFMYSEKAPSRWRVIPNTSPEQYT